MIGVNWKYRWARSKALFGDCFALITLNDELSDKFYMIDYKFYLLQQIKTQLHTGGERLAVYHVPVSVEQGESRIKRLKLFLLLDIIVWILRDIKVGFNIIFKKVVYQFL